MKCCGSRTTSTVPELRSGEAAVPRSQSAASRSRDVAATFEALLMKSAFGPVSRALGFYGDLVVGEVAQTVARGEHGGLVDRLVEMIDDASPTVRDNGR